MTFRIPDLPNPIIPPISAFLYASRSRIGAASSNKPSSTGSRIDSARPASVVSAPGRPRHRFGQGIGLDHAQHRGVGAAGVGLDPHRSRPQGKGGLDRGAAAMA